MPTLPRCAHYRDLTRICPDCGKPSHVAFIPGTGKFFWLHDDHVLELGEVVPSKIVGHASMEISVSELDALFLEAEARGADCVFTFDAPAKPRRRGCRAVVCVETGKVFESAAKAADVFGCGRSSIANAIRREGLCKGYHWRYA